MQNKLTLLIPGLLQPPQSLRRLPAGDKPAFQLLNRFFSRAKESQFPINGFYATLFYLFGVDLPEEYDYPVAALSYLADAGNKEDGWCLRCDPAFIHADMDRAVLMGHGELALTAEEAEQLLMIINTHIEQDGWQIEAHAVDRWYVKGVKQKQFNTTPPQFILGQDIKYDLPKGTDGAYWCSIMNECQMLLHELPVNLQRQARGLPPVNSLWFWGGGNLPDKAHCPYDKVFANDPLIEGLSMLSVCAYGQPEQGWRDIQQHDNHNYLMVLDKLLSPQLSGDLFAWLDAVKQFEQDTMQNIITMLKTKRLANVTLLTADGRSFQLTPAMLHHWWKRQPKYISLTKKAIN